MPVKLVMTACDAASDIISIHGIDKDIFTEFRSYMVDSGSLASFRADPSGALVGRRIADRYGWKQGQRVTLKELGDISFNVCGVFNSTNSAQENLILAGRKFVQESVDKQGLSNHVLIKLKKGASPDEVCMKIDAMPFTVQVNTESEQVFLSEALDQLKDIVEISNYVILAIVLVILIAMGNALSMTARERYMEFGIMRTLGFSRNSIVAIIMAEGVVLTLAGGIIGSGLVLVLVHSGMLKTVSTCGISITMEYGAASWLLGTATLVIAGAIGSMVPAWNASRIEAASVIRRRGL